MTRDKVTQVFIDRLVEDALTTEKLPWEEPWRHFNTFNYFTHHVYTGINQWILPHGEYMTSNQINTYNEQRGTNYRYKKGIKWYPVLFVKQIVKEVAPAYLPAELTDKFKSLGGRDGSVGYSGYHFYVVHNGKLQSVRKVRRFYSVAERKFFVDEKGEPLPSKIETGEMEITYSNAETVVDTYLSREKIPVEEVVAEAWYRPSTDTIGMPPIGHFKDEEGFFSTFFHEMAHSTGHTSRLFRKDVMERSLLTPTNVKSREEVLAELTAAMLCAETGIMSYESQNGAEYESRKSYIQSWIQYLKDSKDDIITTMSHAHKAFKYILGESVANDSFMESPK